MEADSYDTDVLRERALAQLVDSAVALALGLGVFLGGVLVIAEFVGVTAGAGATATAVEAGMTVAVASGFLSGFAYSAGLEHYWDGQTVGKRLFDVRVLSVDGTDASAEQVAVRNTPAILYLGYLFVVVALAAIATSERDQRLFDRVASTVVVRDEDCPGTDRDATQF